MSPWGWSPERSRGVWRHGPGWMKPFVAAAPWLTIGVLLMTFHFIGNEMSVSKGVLFDLPAEGVGEGEATGLVALVLPKGHETLVFFDDSRYLLGDAASVDVLRGHLADRAGRVTRKTLLVLADRRVAGGDLMKLASVARKGGLDRVLFAEKRKGRTE